ncbi:MAG: DUF1573 domain-containing protein [Clostridium sp.]|nr:DUF1573 domain-containing protein [Clostridium sp.]
MKRILFILAAFAALLWLPLSATGAEKDSPLTFETTNHDFGTVHASKGEVSYEFKFTNTSSEPVAILMVTNGGCGCTTPSYPKKPIEPGKSASIKITFSPAGRQGEFNREVKVRYAAAKKKGKLSLTFSGVVVP